MRLHLREILLLVPSFNPRICKRCDYHINRFRSPRISFNPRICKRCDFHFGSTARLSRCFNPRICKRCDIFTQLTIFTTTVSIHASVKDATEVMQRMAKMYTVSIHASVKDATNESCSSQSQISFNPRICKRCDAICFVG